MDHIDKEILSCLRQNARMPASRIGSQINLSVSSVLERIRRMEEQGIILRYTTIVDQAQLGQTMALFIGVTMEKSRYYESFIQAIKEEPTVLQCDHVTGSFDFLLRASVSSQAQLKELHHKISNMTGVSLVTSNLILETIKDI